MPVSDHSTAYQWREDIESIRISLELIERWSSSGPEPSQRAALRAACIELQRAMAETTAQERRANAVAAVARAGERYASAASDEERKHVAVRLVDDLVFAEGSEPGTWTEDADGTVHFSTGADVSNLGGLLDDLDTVKELLASYDPAPRGKRGRRSAAAILARIIATDVPAFDLDRADGEAPATAEERIRKRLEDDFATVQRKADPASK